MPFFIANFDQKTQSIQGNKPRKNTNGQFQENKGIGELVLSDVVHGGEAQINEDKSLSNERNRLEGNSRV
jgi:hypothetical protein